MSATNFVDLCSDDEIGEADEEAVKREADLDPGMFWQKECYRAKQVLHRKSKTSTGQESEENRSSNALSTVQSSSSILDQGSSPIDVSTLSSASPGRSVTLCQQFWKAGNYDVVQGSKAGLQNGCNHLRVHPKFLHSNATSHKWAFGAIAELLDNAVDEIQNGATFIVVDKTSNPRNGSAALLIQEDDGGGMDPEAMRRCMSFGFSDKKSKSAIGQYGNGFKTSSMRLGADVIVFSRHMKKRFGSDNEILHYDVQLVDYEFNTSNGTLETLLRYGKEHFTSNLSMLLQWSPYATEAELLKQVNFRNFLATVFDDIGHHGTKVIIYNLWFNDDGDMELDFDSDAEDICINKDPNMAQRCSSWKTVYSSILYLRIPQSFRIILRGQVVEHHNIANDLKFPEFILYRPKMGGNMEAAVVTTIGFLKDAPHVNIHGFNVYHKNRLILPFWHVVNNQTDSRGRGVVGEKPLKHLSYTPITHPSVLEANFIEPTHDKQDFEKTTLFQKLESRLKEMTLEYWDFHCGLIGYQQKKKQPPASVLPQKAPVSGTYSCLQQTVMTNYSSPLIDSPRSASAGGAFQDPAATSSYPLAGRPGQPIGNCPYSSQTGVHIKRKDPHSGVEPEVVKRQTGTGAYDFNTKHNWGRQPSNGKKNGIENQLQDQEATSLMQENKNLRAQCLGFQKREKELNLKVQQLRGELGELQREYARMLAESQSMDAIKEENM
ncbi:hypothetical protein HHK36_015607 [Tetracentron sinense]|uniref:Morc S5 domain-containing protein n=1 Tax=Tetracentron sinense TaxID=13715 RepID=A0A835DE14_TETSI|nr:hypothetical protein HHK36_015607 [Tetracentron sinense]